MKIEKTRNYEMFKTLDCQRNLVESHVVNLMKSIEENNKMNLHPILVNEDMEVIDGQHRLEAARRLKIFVFYQVDYNFKEIDVITWNKVSKNWSHEDYLKFWIHRGNANYIRFKTFIDKMKCDTRKGLTIMNLGLKHDTLQKFREGSMEFVIDVKWEIHMALVDETLVYIRQFVGSKNHDWTSSMKLYISLMLIVRHPDFNLEVWKNNLSRHIKEVRAKNSRADYIEMFLNIYNWHLSSKRINMDELE
jgi:hypothetical protein